MANLSVNFLQHENALNLVLLNTILKLIGERYFGGKATAVVHSGNQPGLLTAVLNSLEIPVIVSSENDKLPSVHCIALGGSLWQPAWRPRGRMLVVTDRNDIDHIGDWMTTLWKTWRFLDLAVMVVDNQPFQFYTFFPFDEKCDGPIQPKLTNLDELYPRKFHGELYGCELRTISDWIMPYVRKEITEPAGVEDLIYEELLLRLNATAKTVELDGNDRVWLLADTEGNLIGGGKKMAMQQADVMFGGLTYSADFLEAIEMLLPHSMDSLAWFVPSPQPIASPLKLYLAFTSQVWLLVAAVFAVTALTLSVFSYTLLTDIAALTLNLPASASVPNSLLIFSYIYSLHITSTYQASLFMLFSRTVMEKPLETVEEAAETNLLRRFFNHHRPLMNLTNHQLWTNLFKRHVFADRQNPANFFKTRDFVILVQMIPQTFYIKSLNLYDDFGPALLPLSERFLMNPVLFYVSKGNPIGPAVNSIIQHLVDGGIVRHWLDNFIGRIVIRQATFNSENTTLHFSHLSGAFLLLGCGLLGALLIFLTEGLVLIFGKCYKKPKILKRVPRYPVSHL